MVPYCICFGTYVSLNFFFRRYLIVKVLSILFLGEHQTLTQRKTDVPSLEEKYQTERTIVSCPE